MVRTLASSVAGIVFGAVLMMTLVEPGRVHAAPCPDIYKLVEAGVSDKMLEQAIRASAQDITPDVATCVEQMGVSVDVVRLVRSLAKEAAASAPVAPQQSPPVSDRAQPSPSDEASSPKEQRAEAWLRTVPMRDELAAPAPSRSVSATQSVPEPTVPTREGMAWLSQAGGYTISIGLLGSGAGLLVKSFGERRALGAAVVAGDVSVDDPDALSMASSVNKKVTLGYGCLALGVGAAVSTKVFLAAGHGRAGFGFRGEW